MSEATPNPPTPPAPAAPKPAAPAKAPAAKVPAKGKAGDRRRSTSRDTRSVLPSALPALQIPEIGRPARCAPSDRLLFLVHPLAK